MIKKINVILVIVAMVFMMLIPAKNALAKDKQILTMEATQANGKISVSGTAEEGTLAVAIAIYNSDGSKFIKMITTSVDSSNKYAGSIDAENGSYMVRVADYEGGDYAEQLIKVGSEAQEKSDETPAEEAKSETESGITQSVTNGPKTGDFVAMYVGIFVLGAIVLTIAVKGRNKKKKNNR